MGMPERDRDETAAAALAAATSLVIRRTSDQIELLGRIRFLDDSARRASGNLCGFGHRRVLD